MRRVRAEARAGHTAKRRAASGALVALLTPLWLLVTAPSAHALPGPCDIPGVSTACDILDGTKEALEFAKDPFGFIAKQMGEGAKWLLEKILVLMDSTTRVDFSNPGFLKQYGLIFAASTIFTIALWLIAVAKRAVRGVPLTTAISEAVGLLLLQVVVAAFTPAALALVMQVTDEVSKVFAGSALDEGRAFIDHLTDSIDGSQGAAPAAMIIIFLLIMIAALLVWIELLVRAGALYIGAALGPLVTSGLVDRDLWGQTKRWCGMLFALAMIKPVLFALFGLAAAISNTSEGDTGDKASAVLTGALMLFLAVFCSAVLYKWLPSMGDDMAHMMHARKAMGQAGPAAAVPGPAQAANGAMSARMSSNPVVRGGGGGGATGGEATAAAGGPAAAAAAAKKGIDLAKDKAGRATSIPDHGSSDHSDERANSGRTTDGESAVPGGVPATVTAPGAGATSPSIVAAEGESAPSAEASSGAELSTPSGPPLGPSMVPNSAPEGSESSESSPASHSGPSIPTPSDSSTVPTQDDAAVAAGPSESPDPAPRNTAVTPPSAPQSAITDSPPSTASADASPTPGTSPAGATPLPAARPSGSAASIVRPETQGSDGQ